MAKTVGSEDGPKIKTPGAPPPAGDNVTRGTFLEAVQDIVEHRGKVEAAKNLMSARRKHWKSLGITLGALDRMVKMAEWSRGEIRDHFDTERQYAEWLGLPTGPRPKGQTDEETHLFIASEWRAMGRTANLAGKPAQAPEECPGENVQDWLAGWNEADEETWADAEPERPPVVPDKPPAAAKPEEPPAAPPAGAKTEEKPKDKAPKGAAEKVVH